MPNAIIWPLLGKVFSPVFLQQQPRSGPRPPPIRPLWGGEGAPTEPRVVHQLVPYPATNFRITGTTRDSTGVALGSCTVHWFRTSDDVELGITTSDASGLFAFAGVGQPPNGYYLVAYKPGSPDVAGTTINTLVGTA